MADIPTFKMDVTHILKDDFEMYLATNYDLFFRRLYDQTKDIMKDMDY